MKCMTSHKEIGRSCVSSKLIHGAPSFNIYESKIIEEEHSEYDQALNSPMPRLEENKSSEEEQDIKDIDWFSLNDSEEIDSPTPRFENQSGETLVMK